MDPFFTSKPWKRPAEQQAALDQLRALPEGEANALISTWYRQPGGTTYAQAKAAKRYKWERSLRRRAHIRTRHTAYQAEIRKRGYGLAVQTFNTVR